MKLASLILGGVLALGGVAHADDFGPPADPYTQPMPAPRAHRHGAFKQMLMARFDRNHDGRLEPRERRKAARALRRMAAKLDAGGRMGRRAMIQRYDLNGDGNVGPGEMPPAMANRMRRYDRDGNGWVDPGEMR